MKTGILYTIFKNEREPHKEKNFTENLLMSIASVRRFNDLPITVITDRDDLELEFNNLQIKKIKFEDYSIEHKINNQRLTIRKLQIFKNHLPYEMTIFSDADILFLDNPEKIIDEKFDLSIARDCHFQGPPRLGHMLNTGLYAVKNDRPFKSVVEKACDILHHRDSYPEIPKKIDPVGDQYFIHVALDYVYDIDIKILPAQWNVRAPLINEVKNPKVIHCKNLSLKRKFIC